MAVRSAVRGSTSTSANVPPIDAVDVLASVGEVAYRRSIAEDTLVWSGDVKAVHGLRPEAVATGRAFAAHHDPASPTSRHDAVFGDRAADRGDGVSFEVEYGLRPLGQGWPILWVEDCGRWYGDGTPGPRRVVGIVRVVTDRHERETRLAFRSSHDELTGFFNRARLLELLAEALASAERFQSGAALMVIAIDNFRLINDCYGFDVADQVLAATARRIASRLRGGDAIGRFSGNKLAVILRDGTEQSMATAANRFLKVAREEVVATGSGAIAVSVSIGGVTLPRNARSVGEAIARAEESLSEARQSGQGRFVPYVRSPRREEERQANAALSSELIAALAAGRLRLAYQPVVDAVTRRPAFHEALLRLERDTGEVVQACQFMPLAERLGVSRLLDQRSLELALQALERAPALRLSLNVSPATAGEPAWLSALAAAVRGQPAMAERLTVEITESSAIRNLDEAVAFVCAVRDLGCAVAIDDLGAGYTSFRNLRQLGIDIVKIDGAFVENLRTSRDDQVFVTTLATLARNFDLKTVAERVGDEDSIKFLIGLGVNYLQGDLVGVPSLDLPQP